jgi:hypothetical protein
MYAAWSLISFRYYVSFETQRERESMCEKLEPSGVAPVPEWQTPGYPRDSVTIPQLNNVSFPETTHSEEGAGQLNMVSAESPVV